MPDNLELIKFIASFAILVIFLYALYYYLQRVQHKFNIQGKDLKILETKPLGKNRFIFLVEAKDTLLLLSSDENGIKVLKEWKKNG